MYITDKCSIVRSSKEDEDMTDVATCPLRLPKSLKDHVARVATGDGTSMNQFISIAVAEKLAVLEAATFFKKRRKRVDMKAFRKTLNRDGGAPPCPGDE
jgi:hypothetical protein